MKRRENRLSELPFLLSITRKSREPRYFRQEGKNRFRVSAGEISLRRVGHPVIFLFFGTPGAGLRRCIFRRAAGRSRLSPPGLTVIS